jgi:hypothetical protein
MASLKKVDGHSELLEDLLYDLVQYGIAVVPEQKLMRWTDTKRVTAKMWKYIHELFDEVLEAADEHKVGWKLYVGEGSDFYSFLIWDRGEGEGKVQDPWWQPIELLEQPKKIRARRGRGSNAELEVADA